MLKAEDLRDAAKKNPKANALSLSEELYSDQVGAKNRNGVFEGLRVFQRDVARNTKINGKIKKVKEDEDQTQFHEMIRKELGIDPAKLDTAYSQNLLSILTHTLNYNNQIGITNGYNYSLGFSGGKAEDSVRDTNFYREDNEVYCKIIIKEYTVSQSFQADTKGESKNFVIPGPIEVVYKLVNDHEGSMFALQHIATDSDFLRDVFLAKNIELQNQLKSELIDVNTLTLLKNINELLMTQLMTQPSKENKNPLIIKEAIANSFYKALTAVGQYQKKQLSTDQLVEALERVKMEVEAVEVENEPTSKQSFIKRHSLLGKHNNKPATHAIQQAIDKAKQLPAQQVVAVVDKSKTETVSPSTDTKNENAEQSTRMRR